MSVNQSVGSPGPTQPIAFYHRVHVNELHIPCAYCHWTVAFALRQLSAGRGLLGLPYKNISITHRRSPACVSICTPSSRFPARQSAACYVHFCPLCPCRRRYRPCHLPRKCRHGECNSFIEMNMAAHCATGSEKASSSHTNHPWTATPATTSDD
jgi:hypothetical protein